jgi:hypothetical protein
MEFNSRSQESRLISQWRSTIESFGGTWVGIQPPLLSDPEGPEAKVVFMVPGHKHYSYLPVSEMTLENIKKAMGISDPEPESDTVAHLEHAAKRLRNLAKQLILTADEIDEEIKCLKSKT